MPNSFRFQGLKTCDTFFSPPAHPSFNHHIRGVKYFWGFLNRFFCFVCKSARMKEGRFPQMQIFLLFLFACWCTLLLAVVACCYKKVTPFTTTLAPAWLNDICTRTGLLLSLLLPVNLNCSLPLSIIIPPGFC